MQGRYISAIVTVTVVVVLGGLFLVLVGLPVTEHKPWPELSKNIAKWRATGIRSYEMTLERLCECDVRPIRVTVENGKVTKVVFVQSGEVVMSPEKDPRFRLLTIDGIFDDIAESYAGGYFKVLVTFDPLTGIPLQYFLDRSATVIDDEVTIRIADFSSKHGG